MNIISSLKIIIVVIVFENNYIRFNWETNLV